MKLTILSTSDIHGYIYPTDYKQRDQDLPFGLLKIDSIIKEILAKETDPVLVIDNGDFLQGSPLTYYTAKQTKHPARYTSILNDIGFDAGILGNHEFNYGKEYLADAIATLDHPILCANILNDQGQPAFGKPYELFTFENLTVAVLGLTTQYIPNWEQPASIASLSFQSAVTCAQEYVPKLQELADVVIVSYHGGFEKDLTTGEPTEALTGENEGFELLKRIPGIDVLLTGHQHREIATVNSSVAIVQPGDKGHNIGKVSLTIEKEDGKFDILSKKAELISAKNTLTSSNMAEKYHGFQNEIEDWLDQKIGDIEGDMWIKDSFQVRLTGHPYIDFIHKVQMEATGTTISGTALFTNDSKGFGPTVTMRDIVTNYIYPNTLAVVEVTGNDLKRALEKSASYFSPSANGQLEISPAFLYPKPQQYNYDMYAGIDYTIDVSLPTGSRIRHLSYNGKLIQEDDRLEIVINQYRAVGGGNYDMFSADKIVREVTVDMTELIAEYFNKHSPIQPSTFANFQVIQSQTTLLTH
ncbi:bifunctional metallophosphatase/5'-nucleotidase [Carnobacterium jeotgali]|uniref:bifunctional metallophosphatase/5'-nucleotidase n=1 Tax=Carnobacterium jeotgali TaxID=545534 RepID=UPI003890FCCE